jgi:MYXO-CTERM domain-containing protein
MKIAGGALVLCLVSVAHAETFHVSASGSDAAAGSEAAPFETIQRAANVVGAGDSVVVHAGTYAGFKVTKRGTEAAPITFKSDGDVTIAGAMTTNRDAIWIEDSSYIVIDGFAVTQAQRAGISALTCDHVTVKNNKADQNGRWGIFSAFCDDFVVEHNEASRSGTEHGIYASNSADRPIIRDNTVWGNAMAGIHMNGDINFGGDGIISDAIIEGNVLRDNGRLGGSAINGDGIVGATIRNNVLDGNHASGVSLYAIDGGAPSTGNRVINNTIRMASDARWAINIDDGSVGNTIRNNVLFDANPNRGAVTVCATCMAGLVADHNAVVGRFELDGNVVGLDAWRTRTGDTTSFVATDDLFVNAGQGDHALRPGSPAIDAGVADGAPATDIAGTARPQGAAIDIGAYEHCDGACATPPEDPEAPENPVDDEPPSEHTGSGGGCSTSGAGSPALLLLVGLGLLGRRRRRLR